MSAETDIQQVSRWKTVKTQETSAAAADQKGSAETSADLTAGFIFITTWQETTFNR